MTLVTRPQREMNPAIFGGLHKLPTDDMVCHEHCLSESQTHMSYKCKGDNYYG